jgi:hypothetical protein
MEGFETNARIRRPVKKIIATENAAIEKRSFSEGGLAVREACAKGRIPLATHLTL